MVTAKMHTFWYVYKLQLRFVLDSVILFKKSHCRHTAWIELSQYSIGVGDISELWWKKYQFGQQ